MASFLARTAGLGDNPPVANAKTAQTAANATNATNAQNAGNAATVGGFAPNGLVRVAGAVQTKEVEDVGFVPATIAHARRSSEPAIVRRPSDARNAFNRRTISVRK